jgi:PE family
MSVLRVVPEFLEVAATDVAQIGSTLNVAHVAAAASTTGVAAPAIDEVSQAITSVLVTQAHDFQAVSAEAASYHDQFVNLLKGSAAKYVSAEAANAEQTLIGAVNTPAQALLGHPVIETGPGSATAVANPAETIVTNSFGPFEVFTEVTGGVGFTGIRINTPFGPGVLFAEGGTTSPTPDGGYVQGYYLRGPFVAYDQLSAWPPGTFGGPGSVVITLNGLRLVPLEALINLTDPNYPDSYITG